MGDAQMAADPDVDHLRCNDLLRCAQGDAEFLRDVSGAEETHGIAFDRCSPTNTNRSGVSVNHSLPPPFIRLDL